MNSSSVRTWETSHTDAPWYGAPPQAERRRTAELGTKNGRTKYDKGTTRNYLGKTKNQEPRTMQAHEGLVTKLRDKLWAYAQELMGEVSRGSRKPKLFRPPKPQRYAWSV